MKKRIKILNIIALMLFVTTASIHAQKKNEPINDSNTPLHLLKPDYNVPYRVLTKEDIKVDIDRILHYLESCTPTKVVDKRDGKVIENYKKIDENSQLERGTFRLASYEWGVTYSAILSATLLTPQRSTYKHVTARFSSGLVV